MPLSIEEWKQRFDKASGDDVAKCRALLTELVSRLTEPRESEAIERALRDFSEEYKGKENIKTLIYKVAKALGGTSQLTPGSDMAMRYKRCVTKPIYAMSHLIGM